MLDGLFPFAQMLHSGGRSPRFDRILEKLGADCPAHVQMVRGLALSLALSLPK